MANIVITGANQGIGYYFTEKALMDGNKVAVLDLEVDNLKNLAKIFPDSLSYHTVDVCNEAQMQAAIADIIEKSHKIDIAIHNACRCTFDREAITGINIYEQVFDVNYYGALRLVKCVLPYMQAQKVAKSFLQALAWV